jgi:hypothetical protein
MLAYDYPVLGLFLTMLWFVIWAIWLILLFRVIADIFRDRQLGGFAKALWLIFVVLLPYLGVIVYVIVRGAAMGERDVQQVRASDQAMREYIREAAGTEPSVADELAKLADLRDRGVINDAEFTAQKSRLMA